MTYIQLQVSTVNNITCSFSQMGQCLSVRLFIQKVVVIFEGTYFPARLRRLYVLMCMSSHLTPLYHTTGHSKYMFVWTFGIICFYTLHLNTLFTAWIFITCNNQLFLRFWSCFVWFEVLSSFKAIFHHCNGSLSLTQWKDNIVVINIATAIPWVGDH